MAYTVLTDIAARLHAEALGCFDDTTPVPRCYELGTIPTNGGIRIEPPEWCCQPMSLWAWWDHEVVKLGGRAQGCAVKEVLNVTVALDVCTPTDPMMSEEDLGEQLGLVTSLGYRMWSGLCAAFCNGALGDVVTPGPLLADTQSGCTRFTTRWRIEDIKAFPLTL